MINQKDVLRHDIGLFRGKRKFRQFKSRFLVHNVDRLFKLMVLPVRPSDEVEPRFSQWLKEIIEAEGKPDLPCIRLFNPLQWGFNSFVLFPQGCSDQYDLWVRRWHELTSGHVYSEKVRKGNIAAKLYRRIFHLGYKLEVLQNGKVQFRVERGWPHPNPQRVTPAYYGGKHDQEL